MEPQQLSRVKILNRSASENGGGVITPSRINRESIPLTREHGPTLRLPILLQVTPENDSCLGGNEGRLARNEYAEHDVSSNQQLLNHNIAGGMGSVPNQGRQGDRILALGRKPRNTSVILNPEVQGAAAGVGEAHNRPDDVVVGQAAPAALELDVQSFAWRQCGWIDNFFHTRYPITLAPDPQ